MTPVVRALRQDELDEADRIMRTAFGTFLGLPDPLQFMGDADYVRSRWAADPSAALAAEVDGRLVGTNFATRWGSVGFFGPLTVEPALWNAGVARRLLDATMEIFDGWGVTHRGLFTFSNSPKHLALYSRYGFQPRYLTAVMSCPVPHGSQGDVRLLSAAHDPEQEIADCAALTGSIYPGLDVGREIRAAATQNLGDTVLSRDDEGLAGVAVCHSGPRTEAGSGAVYVKFAAVRPGPGAEERFARLVTGCEAYAAARGAGAVHVGVNTARRGAHRLLTDRGYRAYLVGIAMHSPDESAYHDESAWVLDDWR